MVGKVQRRVLQEKDPLFKKKDWYNSVFFIFFIFKFKAFKIRLNKSYFSEVPHTLKKILKFNKKWIRIIIWECIINLGEKWIRDK
jgi:hypothetical protein